MSTSFAEEREFISLESEKRDLKRFISLSKLTGHENLDADDSAERYNAVSNSDLKNMLGIEVFWGVVRRPGPITAQQVRTAPSSTSKVVEWEGVVESVGDDEFACRLRIIKGSEVDFDEFTTFDLDRVDEGDRDLVQPGALFRLVIGFQAISGTRQQFSRLIFRRLPAWNRSTIEQARAHIEDVFDSIDWSDGSAS